MYAVCVQSISKLYLIGSKLQILLSTPFFCSHENAQDFASVSEPNQTFLSVVIDIAPLKKSSLKEKEISPYVWLSDDCEIEFSIVVQGHSVTHLDPSLNTRANFLHPFKLSSSYHLIKAKRKLARSPLLHDCKSNVLQSASLSLTHSYFLLRSLTAGVYTETIFTPGNLTV